MKQKKNKRSFSFKKEKIIWKQQPIPITKLIKLIMVQLKLTNNFLSVQIKKTKNHSLKLWSRSTRQWGGGGGRGTDNQPLSVWCCHCNFFVLFYHKPHIIRYEIIIIRCSATNRSPLKLVIHHSFSFPSHSLPHLLILISYRHPYRRGHCFRLLYTHCTHNSAPQQRTEKPLNNCCQSVLKWTQSEQQQQQHCSPVNYSLQKALTGKDKRREEEFNKAQCSMAFSI